MTTLRCPECQTENPETQKFCGECGTQLEKDDSVKPSRQKKAEISHTKTLQTPVERMSRGTVFADRYEIIEELGIGGMGKVFRVYDKKIEEEIALKFLNPEIAADMKTIKRFTNELKFARKIVHKNVCRMFDINEEAGTSFITMEYVPGEDLKSLIRRTEKLTVGKAISVAKQVAAGLSEAHKLGVIHRDLKPHNIMIDKNGDARIMDFGIARSLSAKGVTAEGIIIGTPDYMSPEQVSGKEVDQQSDIYALGVILFEMVTGGLPFEGETPLSVAVKHKSEPPPEPKSLNNLIPEDLNQVILRCLDKDREQRYQSAEALYSELSRIERALPTTERTAPKKKPITSREISITLGVKKMLLPALILAAVVISALVIWSPWSKPRATPLLPSDKPSLAILYFENNSGDMTLDNFKNGLSNLLTSDLGQSELLYVLSIDRINQLLKQMDLLEAEKYTTDDLRRIANLSGVSHIMYGRFITLGEEFRIDTSLFDCKTETVLNLEGEKGIGKESINTSIDGITRKVKSSLNFSEKQISQDIDRAVGDITTHSSNAHAFFLKGAKHYFNFEYDKAIEAFNKAVSADPNYAIAYRYLGSSYHYSKNWGRADAEKAILRALDLIDHASEREQLIIKASYYSFEEDFDKLFEVSSQLYERYPTEFYGNNGLGYTYANWGNWEKAAELFAFNMRNFPDNAITCLNLAYQYMFLGSFNKVEEILQGFLKKNPYNRDLHYGLIQCYFHQNRTDLLLAELEKFYSSKLENLSYLRLRSDAFFYSDDLIKAEEGYNHLIREENPDFHMTGFFRLSKLHLVRGELKQSINSFKQALEILMEQGEKRNTQFEALMHAALSNLYASIGDTEEALKETDSAWDLIEEDWRDDYKITILFYKAKAHIERGDLIGAQEVSNELKLLAENTTNKKFIRYYHLLMSMIEKKNSNLDQAIELGEIALSLTPHFVEGNIFINDQALFLDSLASLYLESGDLENAQTTYEKISVLTVGRLYFGDIYAKSYFALGKIYEQKSWKGKSIDVYEKFIEFWKNCDTQFQDMVEDAKKRIVDLETFINP